MSVPILSTLRSLPLPAEHDKAPDPEQTVRLAMRVRPRHDEESHRQVASLLTGLSQQTPRSRRHLTAEEWDDRFGAHASDLDRVADFARKKRLSVVDRDRGHRSVVIEAPLKRLEEAFDVKFSSVEHENQIYRTHEGPLLVPKSIEPVIDTVHGLDTTPVVDLQPRAAAVTARNFEVRQVGEMYGFPMSHKGQGQTLVIVSLGGGFRQKDLDRYFSGLGLATPQIEVVGVDGATNQPASDATIQAFLTAQGFDPKDLTHGECSTSEEDSPAATVWTIEATTDIEILGSLAPEARIVVIFAPNTQDSQVAAIEEALSSEFASRYGLPTAISCSWGQYESKLREGSRTAMEAALKKAAGLGVTVCFASGDYGGAQEVYYPASSPHALACGGTCITTPPGQKEIAETVWRERRLDLIYLASGGGMSAIFDAPAWQSAALKPWRFIRRGVPDLAAQASLDTGYALVIGGAKVGMGGTSAVAPLMAGLITQITEANRDLDKDYRVGWLTPLLYGEAFQGAFAKIGSGDNGLYCATEHWDPCTGCGRPIGSKFLEALRARA